MTKQKQIRWTMSVLLLAAGLSMGCTQQASNPVDNNDGATQGAPAPEAGGSGAASDTNSGSGSK
jgi:hypothetical protein